MRVWKETECDVVLAMRNVEKTRDAWGKKNATRDALAVRATQSHRSNTFETRQSTPLNSPTRQSRTCKRWASPVRLQCMSTCRPVGTVKSVSLHGNPWRRSARLSVDRWFAEALAYGGEFGCGVDCCVYCDAGSMPEKMVMWMCVGLRAIAMRWNWNARACCC
jgi:hypothetical protein